jgi:predicted patatin/cPLA2 family phospholipase
MKKLALITSGGGMTCAYSAGFLDALEKTQGLKEVDIAIAGSGGAGSMAYYVAGQNDLSVDIWSNRLSSKKFINPSRFWRIMDIDYLIDDVFKKQDPLDVDRLYSSKTNYLIPAINYKNGEIRYFSNHKDDNIFEALRATKALPIIFGRSIKINDGYYGDSRLSASSEFQIQKACELGATHIITVSSNTPSPAWVKSFQFWLGTRNSRFKENYRDQEEKTANFKPDKNIKIISLAPKEALDTGAIRNDKATLDRLIAMGYEDCRNSVELKAFLDQFRAA